MSRKILVNDLYRHTTSVRDEVIAAMTQVVDSAWFVHGKACAAFEQAFAEYCGTAHCAGVANGTDALELGLRGIGVTSGTRVATVANASFYTATALFAIGAHPVFIDVDATTQLMDLGHLREALDREPVDAVVVTHLYGLMHDMQAVMEICRPRGVRVLEDCAQAHGARRGGQRAGSWGDAATFSFYPTKNLGAIGDGGAVVTNDAGVADRVRLLRQYGWTKKYEVGVLGARNSRLDELQAAVLLAKLPHLDGWNARRRDIASRYSEGINHPRIQVPPRRGDEYVAHLFVIRCEDRESLKGHLAGAGVATDIHYPVPDHRQPAIASLADWPALPVTEALASNVLTLPLYPELSDDEVTEVIQAVNAW